jgi:hypothetical protein
MSRKKAKPKPDDRPPVKFDVRIPIRPDPDPKDPSHYRVLGPGESLPEEYHEHFAKAVLKMMAPFLERWHLKLTDLTGEELAELWPALMRFRGESKDHEQTPGADTVARILRAALERKVAEMEKKSSHPSSSGKDDTPSRKAQS